MDDTVQVVCGELTLLGNTGRLAHAAAHGMQILQAILASPLGRAQGYANVLPALCFSSIPPERLYLLYFWATG